MNRTVRNAGNRTRDQDTSSLEFCLNIEARRPMGRVGSRRALKRFSMRSRRSFVGNPQQQRSRFSLMTPKVSFSNYKIRISTLTKPVIPVRALRKNAFSQPSRGLSRALPTEGSRTVGNDLRSRTVMICTSISIVTLIPIHAFPLLKAYLREVAPSVRCVGHHKRANVSRMVAVRSVFPGQM